jgi:ABC-type amino acid transport substrate-binding protein
MGRVEGPLIGAVNRPVVALYIARTPLTRDPADERITALKAWLVQVANQAGVDFILRAASVERWQAQLDHDANSCALANARLPEREYSAHWLKPVLRDSLVIIGRTADPFQGDLNELLRQADGKIGAASGIYRRTLQERGIHYVSVDDQGAIIQMIDAGRLRFGLVADSAAQTQTGPLQVRILAKLEDVDFWFSCSYLMRQERADRLRKALDMESSEKLRREFLALWNRRLSN